MSNKHKLKINISILIISILIICYIFFINRYIISEKYNIFINKENDNNTCNYIIKNNNDICLHSIKPEYAHELCTYKLWENKNCTDKIYNIIVTTVNELEKIEQYAQDYIFVYGHDGKAIDNFIEKYSYWDVNIIAIDNFEILKSHKSDPDIYKLLKHIDSKQHTCINFFAGSINPHGFGSAWHTSGLALAHSIYYNMTFWPINKSNFFIRTTPCTQFDIEQSWLKYSYETHYSKLSKTTVNYRSLSKDVNTLIRNKNIILDDYKNKGLMWWRSILTYYTIRPNYKTREIIRKESDIISNNCIAIHVRHSDKYEEAKLINLEEYITVARKIKMIHKIDNIYLMTDDPDVIVSATEKYSSEFNINYLPINRSNKGWKYDMMNGIDKETQEIQFITDVFLASNCIHAIVTYSSNVGRLIAEIMYAKQGIPPSVISLDTEWF
jgi:Alpha-(1,6)-fucosyltransferase N- and catalytic domains